MEIIGLLLAAMLTVILVVGLIHFLARRISRRISEKAASQALGGNRPPFIRPGFVLSLLTIFLFYHFFWQIVTWWPPQWVEKRAQRKEVFQRVENAGGWDRLTADVAIMLATNDSRDLWVSGSNTNILLPSSISALKALLIECHPFQKTKAAVFRVYIGHRRHTGYSLCVVPEGSSEEVVQQLHAKWPTPRTVRQITNGVFEVY